MKVSWAMKTIVLGALLLHGLVVASPAPVIPLGDPVVIAEASAFRVGGDGLRIDVLAVGYMWFADGTSDIFAEVVATHRGRKGQDDPQVERALHLP